MLKELILAEAARLGFELAGFTTCDPPDYMDTLETWLARGNHAGMGYMADRQRVRLRANPRELLPGCSSILCLAARYPAPTSLPPPPEGGRYGRVAAYAAAPDYHAAIATRLKHLAGFINQQAGHAVAWRAGCDAVPIMERSLAQRAGLGWIGRNTCLISPSAGSYFVLAELLLDLEMEADAPFPADRCGTCRRCVDACPTGCIREDRTLDATRCISYLTIEHKGEIPLELQPRVGEWLFGCDICQEVCPWNRRHARQTGGAILPARIDLAWRLLREDMDLAREGFEKTFAGTAIHRTGWQSYQRNLEVVLRNTQLDISGESGTP